MVQKLTGSRKTLIALGSAAVVLAAAGVIQWQRAPRSAVAPPPRKGGTVVATIRSEPRSFNAFISRDAAYQVIGALTQAQLVRINRQTDQAEPWLAESWTQDGLRFTLKLRPGIKFSDGAPFSSADVVFAFQAIYDEAVASPIAESLKVAGKPLLVSAPDASTVVMTFPSPYGPGVRVLDNLPILPRHRLEAALRSGTLRKTWGTQTAPSDLAGLGPFVLSSYAPGQRLVFLRNPHYWRRDAMGQALPYLDRVVVEIVPDQDAEMLRLQSGQVDLTQAEVRADDYAASKRAAVEGRLTLVDVGVALDTNLMWFNLQPSFKPNDRRRAWLQHPDLRRAVSYAVDRQMFANTVFLGAAVPVYGPITPGNKTWYAPDAPTYPYDPGRARALLKGLGLEDRNGDGLLEDRQGGAARFALLTQKGNTSRERGAVFIQEELRKVGIAVDVVPLEVGALIDRFTRGDYDAAYFGLVQTDTDPAVNLEFWLSSGSFHVWNPGQRQPSTEWERQVDGLMQRQIASSDLAERKRLFADVQRIYGAELPVICFAAPRMTIATSPRVRNAVPSVLRPHLLWNADILSVRSTS